jgi:hypothetical protein
MSSKGRLNNEVSADMVVARFKNYKRRIYSCTLFGPFRNPHIINLFIFKRNILLNS